MMSTTTAHGTNSTTLLDDEDEQLEAAIQLSLLESQQSNQPLDRQVSRELSDNASGLSSRFKALGLHQSLTKAGSKLQEFRKALIREIGQGSEMASPSHPPSQQDSSFLVSDTSCDEVLARELQAQYDHELASSNPATNVSADTTNSTSGGANDHHFHVMAPRRPLINPHTFTGPVISPTPVSRPSRPNSGSSSHSHQSRHSNLSCSPQHPTPSPAPPNSTCRSSWPGCSGALPSAGNGGSSIGPGPSPKLSENMSDEWWGCPKVARSNGVFTGTPAVAGTGLSGTATPISTPVPPTPAQLSPAIPQTPVAAAPPRDDLAISRGDMCAGCFKYFGWMDGLSRMSAMGCSWHNSCFACRHCNERIGIGATFMIGQDGQPYHEACHKAKFAPKCTLCHEYIPATGNGVIRWNEHPFWRERYCPQHTTEGLPRCNSCQRLQPHGQEWPVLTDGRHLCYVCIGSAVANTAEGQELYKDVMAFYTSMGLPLPATPPLMLVDGPALNEQGALAGRGPGSDGPVFHTRGLCLSEERVSLRPHSMLSMLTGASTDDAASRETTVTAILVLAGLPRLLTGSILAHEVMHAFFRLNGYRDLSPEVEEGTCQLMALLWLEHQKAQPGSQEERLVSFFAHEIRTDMSSVYGEGFRCAYDAFSRVGLYPLLQYIRLHKTFP